MSDPYNEIIIGVGTAGTLITGAFSWLFKRQVATNDSHAQRIEALECDNATKSDITQVEQKFDKRLDHTDRTITDGFKEVQRTLEAAHRRVDDIYRDIPKRGD